MYLIFDTETTGLPKKWNAPVTDSDNWPRCIQLAWQLHDIKGDLISNHSYLIKPDNFTIPFEAEKIHGISTDLASQIGKNIKEVLELFVQDYNKSGFLVGHNVKFDINIVGAELFRLGHSIDLTKKDVLDTCSELTANVCMLPGGRGGKYKYPTLIEIYSLLFKEKFNFPENIIFSHPVAGSHLSGEVNSMDDLFKGKSTILSYHDSAAPLHVNRVMSLWQELGSKVSVLDAELHDRIFAYSSHLPHVVAYALLNTLKEIEQDDLALFSGGGLGEFLRLVSSSPEMWADIFSTNGKNISLAINDLVKNLNILQNKIANDPESLQDLLSELKAFKESNY